MPGPLSILRNSCNECKIDASLSLTAEALVAEIGKSAVPILLKALSNEDSCVDGILDTLSNYGLEVTSEELAQTILQFAGADLAQRLPVDSASSETISSLWQCLVGENEDVRAMAASALQQVIYHQSETA